MSTHLRHKMHVNSLQAYWEGKEELFSQRERDILLAVRAKPLCTDREVMMALHFGDMNSVRPRITELVKDGLLEEHSSVEDMTTGRPVRRLRIRDNPTLPQWRGQGELRDLIQEIVATQAP